MVYKTMQPSQSKASKAVVDLIGGQVAKSGAGWLVQVLLLAAGSINAALSAMALLFFSACVAWLKSTLRLSTQMQQYAEEQAQAEAAADAAADAAQQQQQAELEQQPQQQQQQVVAGPTAELSRRQLEYWQRDWQQQRKARQLRRQHRQRQQLLQQYQGWRLPLPCELAAAAAAASRWYGSEQRLFTMPGAVGSAATATAGSDVDDRSSSSNNGSSSDGGSYPGSSSGRAAHPLLLQPAMLCDAEYWESVYLALAADPALLELAVIGRHGSDIQQQQEQQRAAGGAASRAAQQQQQGSQQQGLAGHALPDMKGVALAKEALHTTFDVY
jgi:hypothetical protein